MSTSVLKTHYRRGATILTPEKIEEIRHLKNKVPVYMIVNEYHINKDHVHDIWNDSERSQQNGNHFFEELRKLQSISSENGSEVHAKQPCEASDESTSKESSEVVGDPLGPSPANMNVQEKQKKKKKLLKSGSIQNSNLPKISAGGSCQNSLLDVSYELITSIKKESEKSMRESEKLFALNSLR
ncbi:5919_t:CDS:1 [Dentiscutata erythropus]|uniref:5919_t:CDS:1 n=1 Tax=Dentiscutata erythropus TaxID=1348616 RepID=A0A9N9PA68_9GLOM|nr:5919_t:CDS:1 [Dentiscutata erythropus]